MTYEETYDFFFNRINFEKRKKINYNSNNFSLEKSTKLLKELNNPENKMRIIHIAGTNGKGSTAFYLEQFLLASGKRVGTFISPHIEKMNERIRNNGQDISDKDLIELAQKIKNMLNRNNDYTTFELIFGASLLHFSNNNSDFVILETGVGGKLDSTNVIKPIITMITKIGLDHQDLLGETLLEITQEKAGIIKDDIPCILHEQEKAVENIIKEKCLEKNAPVHLNSETSLSKFRGIDKILMAGNSQKENFQAAATAHSLLDLKLDDKKLFHCLSNNYLPGRIEKVTTPSFEIIMDGGHNPSALQSLADYIIPQKKKIITIVAMMSNKDIKQNMKIINRFSSLTILTELKYTRAATVKELTPFANKNTLGASSVEDALTIAYNNINKDDLLIITGSFYLIGKIRKLLRP